MQRQVPRVPQPYDSLVFPILAAGAAAGLVWMRVLTPTYMGIRVSGLSFLETLLPNYLTIVAICESCCSLP